jgi:hypothetical protein
MNNLTPPVWTEEVTMSLLQQVGVYQGSNEKSGYGFVLALICVALALVIASVMFTPTAISGEIPLIGP